MKNKSKKSQGFSIIELMVTLLIASILMSYGLPAYHDFTVRQKMTNDINDWLGDVTLTRVTAVKRGQRVVIQSLAGSDWTNGWQVFMDVDSDDVYTAAIDDLIRIKQNIGGDMTMDSAASGDIIAFDNLGALTGLALLGGGFQMNIDHVDVSKSVLATVSPSGMISTVDL
ncbi:MAG: GspH/FimT family pseudopilin [Alcanivoracaceae bacterium]|nr:GspH/FimT family pseudopilin [Alcanivoracaceae bacterium]